MINGRNTAVEQKNGPKIVGKRRIEKDKSDGYISPLPVPDDTLFVNMPSPPDSHLTN